MCPPLEGATYLLDHGAAIDNPGARRQPDSLEPESTLDIVLGTRFGIRRKGAVSYAHWSDVIQLLIRHGAAKGDTASLFPKYTNPYPTPNTCRKSFSNGYVYTKCFYRLESEKLHLAKLLALELSEEEATAALARALRSGIRHRFQGGGVARPQRD